MPDARPANDTSASAGKPEVKPDERSLGVSGGRAVMIFASALVIAFATYAVPFLGFPLSLGLPVLTYRVRQFLWPSVTDRTSRVCSFLAWVGLWLPALVDFFTPWFYANGVEISTSWLIIPLAGPDSIDAVHRVGVAGPESLQWRIATLQPGCSPRRACHCSKLGQYCVIPGMTWL
jgi:hypothetical protein